MVAVLLGEVISCGSTAGVSPRTLAGSSGTTSSAISSSWCESCDGDGDEAVDMDICSVSTTDIAPDELSRDSELRRCLRS